MEMLFFPIYRLSRRLCVSVVDQVLNTRRRMQRLAQILHQVIGVFEAYGKPHRALGDACGTQRGIIHPVVRGGGWMDDQRFGVSDIGQV